MWASRVKADDSTSWSVAQVDTRAGIHASEDSYARSILGNVQYFSDHEIDMRNRLDDAVCHSCICSLTPCYHK